MKSRANLNGSVDSFESRSSTSCLNCGIGIGMVCLLVYPFVLLRPWRAMVTLILSKCAVSCCFMLKCVRTWDIILDTVGVPLVPSDKCSMNAHICHGLGAWSMTA